MNSLQGIVQIWPNQLWKGARAIAVDAVPASLPAGLGGELLARCQQENVSAELCLSTASGAFGRLAVLLILRNLSGHPYETQDRLARAAEMALKLLAAANVRCHLAEPGDGELAWLGRFFGGDLSESTALGFFPPELAPNPGAIYAPGQYGESRGESIDLGRLASEVAGYPDAMLSIQLSATALYPNEQQAVAQQQKRLASLPDDTFARAARQTFSLLEQAARQPLFFVNFFCLGKPEFTDSMAAQLRLWNMRCYRVPPGVTRQGGYAIRGDEWFAEAASRWGHEPHWQGRIPHLMQRMTHLATAGAVAKALPLPLRLQEIRGLSAKTAPLSTQPLPGAFSDARGLYVGKHYETGQPVYIDPNSLVRHGFIVGKPGSGKTVFALGLLYRLQSREEKIPFLAIEPAKREYRSLMEQIPDLKVYTPGRQDLAPMQLNPFLPPKGVTLERFMPGLEAVFSMAISMPHPLDIIFPQVISRCYARYGWRPDSTRETPGVRVFGLHEFIREFRAYISDRYGSDPETLHNLENAGVMRLTRLMDNPLFDTNRCIDAEELLSGPAVVELDALDNNRQKALVMGILLTHVMLTLKQRGDSGSRLRNLILVDEAHLLLSQSDAAVTDEQGSPNASRAVVELLQNMVLILRGYGAALMFGDQSPSRLTRVILENVNLKMMFRLDSQRDRATLTETALLSQAMADSMVTLPAGEGYMHCEAMPAPAHIITPNVEAELKLNKALPDSRVSERMRAVQEPPFSQCRLCPSCERGCDGALRANARFVAGQLASGSEAERLFRSENQGRALTAYLKDKLDAAALACAARFRIEVADEPRFLGCVRAQTVRALLLDPLCAVSEEALLGEEEQAEAEALPAADVEADPRTAIPDVMKRLMGD